VSPGSRRIARDWNNRQKRRLQARYGGGRFGRPAIPRERRSTPGSLATRGAGL
jgi:hypothetical protein